MTQSQRILNYLKPPGRSINPLQALRLFGCFRLGARCWDLKKQGYPIRSEMVSKNGKHFCKYYLA